MPTGLKLPSGALIMGTNVARIIDDATSTITVYTVDGQTATVVLDFATMQQARAQMDNAVTAQSDQGLVVVAPFTITSITPNPFNINTSTITIKGTGFVNGQTYNLYIDDVSGGLDHDGYFMTCTWVSTTQMTAVFGGAGNGILPAGGCYMYARNTGLGFNSNVINATVDASQNVTI